MPSQADQRIWNERFLKILEGDYKRLDSTIAAVLKNALLSRECATWIRSYVDKTMTRRLNADRKARGAVKMKQLRTAIAGLEAAIDLVKNRPDQGPLPILLNLSNEFSSALGRWPQAFNTKRHGRDHAHSILSECKAKLESRLNTRVTYATLANLVNAGFEADGNKHELITEEHLRKNVTRFVRHSPLWRNKIDPALAPLLNDPDTK